MWFLNQPEKTKARAAALAFSMTAAKCIRCQSYNLRLVNRSFTVCSDQQTHAPGELELACPEELYRSRHRR